MPPREPPARRRRSFREPDLRFLLVCGSQKTERDYLIGLRDLISTDSIDVKIVERPKSPDQVVEYARDHCGYRDFDETWCILDVDHYEAGGKKVTAAASLAGAANIALAISNPCFEYWLLLHYRDTGAPFTSCDAVAERLGKCLPSYDKLRLRFGDFSDRIEAAVKRARQRDPSGTTFTINPSSGMWVLVERLLQRGASP